MLLWPNFVDDAYPPLYVQMEGDLFFCACQIIHMLIALE